MWGWGVCRSFDREARLRAVRSGGCAAVLCCASGSLPVQLPRRRARRSAHAQRRASCDRAGRRWSASASNGGAGWGHTQGRAGWGRTGRQGFDHQQHAALGLALPPTREPAGAWVVLTTWGCASKQYTATGASAKAWARAGWSRGIPSVPPPSAHHVGGINTQAGHQKAASGIAGRLCCWPTIKRGGRSPYLCAAEGLGSSSWWAGGSSSPRRLSRRPMPTLSYAWGGRSSTSGAE
jgi:hypothetical protein